MTVVVTGATGGLGRCCAHELAAAGRQVVLAVRGTHFGTWRENGGMIPAPRWRDPRELARPRAGDGREAYSTSKLANVLCALELARRTPTHQATATAFDPGLMPGTELARDAGPVARWAWKNVMPALTRLPGPISSAQRSGVHLARLVTDPALAGVTGRYVAQGRPKPPSAQAQDPVLAADLWRASDELVGLPAQ